ncbi:hypothetical protein [Streptomyces longisporus]|uniref:Uncharacterized protein n=1 Tax=Streptomyces longisporus TaxID=1948 RepID=A0ABN3NF68_STRLO
MPTGRALDADRSSVHGEQLAEDGLGAELAQAEAGAQVAVGIGELAAGARASIRHTGKNGTAVSLDPVTFTYQMRPDRVDSSTDNVLPLNRPRIQTITFETGAVTTVTLPNPECVRGSSMPSSEDNDTMSCYPVYWHVNGATEASLDWFNKYQVTDVITSDLTGRPGHRLHRSERGRSVRQRPFRRFQP